MQIHWTTTNYYRAGLGSETYEARNHFHDMHLAVQFTIERRTKSSDEITKKRLMKTSNLSKLKYETCSNHCAMRDVEKCFHRGVSKFPKPPRHPNQPRTLSEIPSRISLSLLLLSSPAFPPLPSPNYVIKFQNASNLYPPRKDISQMLNGIIWRFLFMRLDVFKNDSISWVCL